MISTDQRFLLANYFLLTKFWSILFVWLFQSPINWFYDFSSQLLCSRLRWCNHFNFLSAQLALTFFIFREKVASVSLSIHLIISTNHCFIAGKISLEKLECVERFEVHKEMTSHFVSLSCWKPAQVQKLWIQEIQLDKMRLQL